MITAINTNNEAAYKKLFEAAMSDLNNGVSINSLETYFSQIEALVGMTKGADQHYGRKYSILPVMSENDYFIIDANARTIRVPDAFRKNGLGVQGDQTAETIYFKINRYFDAMDLNNTDIYIQWENAEGEQGLAKEWVRDIHTYDDYMVFVWVLGNAITETPGPLKFSVRFIKTTGEDINKKITYSLNTLTAQAMINSSLDLPIGIANDELNDILAGNFQDTKTHTDSEVRLFKFVYNFDNLLEEKDEQGNIPNLNGQVISADLVDGKLEFLISAYIEPGTLHYNIYKQIGEKPEPNSSEDKATKKSMEFVYRPTPDKAVNIHKVYYKLNGEEYIKASLEEMGGENAAIQTGLYYEKYGRYELSNTNKLDSNSGITGYYYASAIGLMTDGSETSPMVSDYRVLLSPPTKATFNGNLNNEGQEINSTIIVNASIPTNNVPSYIWSIKRYGEEDYTLLEEVNDNSYVPSEEALYCVEIKTTRNLDSIVTNDKAIYCVTKRPEAEREIQVKINGGSFYAGVIGPQASYNVPNAIAPYGLSYQWYAINDETPVSIEGATNETYNAAAGKYRCEIIATYNGLSNSYMSNIFDVAEIN